MSDKKSIFESENKEKENHSHYCIEEWTSMLKTELDTLEKLWSENKLSCVVLKEQLKEEGLDLLDIADKLEKFNEAIKEEIQNKNSKPEEKLLIH